MENFKKKIFAVGVEEDFYQRPDGSTKTLNDTRTADERKRAIIENAIMIKSLVKDVKPEVVLLELCDDRYDDWFNELAQHPNYDKYMTEL